MSGAMQTFVKRLVSLAFALFISSGCTGVGYNVILAIDAKKYAPGMTWDEIRETGFDKAYRRYTLRVVDERRNLIPLYRYGHESSGLIPLVEAEIDISTPIIVKDNYKTFHLILFENGVEKSDVPVAISKLNVTKGRDKVYVIQIPLQAIS